MCISAWPWPPPAIPPRVEIWNELASPDAPGEHILLTGQVFDGNGNLVRDSFLEFWQADHEGQYDPVYDVEKAFNGFGRTATTFDAGDWTLHTIKPGQVADQRGQPMAPHITSPCSPAASTSTCRPASTSTMKPRPTPAVRSTTCRSRSAAPPCWRAVAKSMAAWPIASTSICRVRRKPSSSISSVADSKKPCRGRGFFRGRQPQVRCGRWSWSSPWTPGSCRI